jgi:hypothetical protein
MPSPETLLIFAALSLGLAVTPGPNMLYLVSRALAQGTGAGMISLIGCQFGSLTIMLCAAAGITVPIVPGILPVSNFKQVQKFSAMCGASVPAWMARLFDGLEEDAETRRLVSAVVAAEQVRLLQANGVDEFHFYTLNRADLTYAIAHLLGVRPGKTEG